MDGRGVTSKKILPTPVIWCVREKFQREPKMSFSYYIQENSLPGTILIKKILLKNKEEVFNTTCRMKKYQLPSGLALGFF